MTYQGSYLEPALKRFKLLQQLPQIKPTKIAAQTVAAVAENKRYVRLPKRSFYYHWLNNAPRRIADIGLTGVKMSRPSKAK